MENVDFTRLLERTKFKLLQKPGSTFFSSVCFSLRHHMDDSISTACTDGKYVKYSPKFFLSLDEEERLFLMLHETLHCAYMHMVRIKQLGWNHRKANIAADYVINLQLVERGFKMPACGLLDYKYAGMSMEQVYKLLPDNPAGSPWDDLQEPADEESGEAIQKDMTDVLIRASAQSKMAGDKPGTIPGEIEIFLNKLLHPKLPWYTILRKDVRSLEKEDYTWKRPNKRYLPHLYLPTLYSESMMEIAVAIDTSGSVTDTQFTQFITEVHKIFQSMKPPKITVIQFDHEIKAVDTVRNVTDLMNIKFTGRGGTCIDPVIAKVNELKPKLLLVFTDGEFNPPSITTKIKTIWLIHDNPHWKAPFGKAIHYELND